MKLGVRQKIVLVLAIVLTLSLGFMGWFTFRQQEDEVNQTTIQRGKSLTHFVSKSLVYNVVAHDYHTLQMLLNDFVAESPELSYARVLSSKRNVMAEAGVWKPGESKDLLFKDPILLEGNPVGELEIGFNNSLIKAQLKTQRIRFIFYEFITIVIIVFGEFAALSYLIVRPVSIIRTALDKGTQDGQIIQPVPVVSNDEIGLLAKQINLMRDQLHDVNLQLRSRIESADAELRETNQALKNMNDELKRLSITDALTGLYNRRHFECTLENEMAMTRRYKDSFSLILIDIDHFKSVNDTYGHVIGDQVLCHVSQWLKKNLRETNMISRIGGEEFAMICKHSNKEQSLLVGEKIRKSVEGSPFDNKGKLIKLTVSIGIATFYASTLTESVYESMHMADEALYHSKRSGRNRITHIDEIKSKGGLGLQQV